MDTTSHYLVSKKDGSLRPYPESEVLQLKCLQDFVQDGDTAIHSGYHALILVDGQHGSEEHVLPCMGGHSAPPVSQIQLAGHDLPVQDSSLWPVIGFSSLHKDWLDPLIVWLRFLRVQLYAYLDDLLIMEDSEVEVTQSIQKTIQVLI